MERTGGRGAGGEGGVHPCSDGGHHLRIGRCDACGLAGWLAGRGGWLGGQVLRSQRAAAGDHGGVFDRVLEFADVARPGPAAEGVAKRLRHGRRRPSGGLPHEKVRRECGDVIPACRQGWHLNRKHMKPMVEVLAKRPRGDRRHEVAVGRGDHADIERARCGSPHRRHFMVLQGSQQFHLQVDRRLADLVEKERAAFC